MDITKSVAEKANTGREKTLVCRICSAPSRCKYFGAVCCESCKVFFRRAVTSGTKYHCTYGNSCGITIATRKLCPSCRFDKCLREGMLVKWVINNPRAVGSKRDNKSASKTPEKEEPIVLQEEELAMISESVNVCSCTDAISSEDSSLVNNLLTTTRQTIQDIPFPDEVFVESPTFTHIINVLSIVVRRMIAFTKTFPIFKSIPIKDQLIILKSVALEIMLTRKATTLLYKVTEKHGMVWMVEKGRFLFSESNLARAYDKTLYEKYMAYITTLMSLKVDDNALVILTCVCLFSPDREDLSAEAQAILEPQQLFYVSLLEKYLHHTYGCRKARQTFPKMLVAQCWAREASHYYSKAAMKCSNSDIEPLMKEFFDME